MIDAAVFTLILEFQEGSCSSSRRQKSSGKVADFEVYIKVLHLICVSQDYLRICKTTCSPALPTQPFSLTIHGILYHTFVHPEEHDITDLMSTVMTKNTPGEADTLVLLPVRPHVTGIQYYLIPWYAEGRHGSPPLWELVYAAAQVVKK